MGLPTKEIGAQLNIGAEDCSEGYVKKTSAQKNCMFAARLEAGFAKQLLNTNQVL